mgnify:CR=1 FL=1
MFNTTNKNQGSKPIKMRIRKGDTVQVINGKEKGKTGEVLKTLPIENRVIVKGINIRTKHVKPTQEGESGRIVTEEFSLHASNVMVYSSDKKVVSRVEIFLDKDKSKAKVCSAVAFVFPPGVFITIIFFSLAEIKSILSTPTPALPMKPSLPPSLTDDKIAALSNLVALRITIASKSLKAP